MKSGGGGGGGGVGGIYKNRKKNVVDQGRYMSQSRSDFSGGLWKIAYQF